MEKELLYKAFIAKSSNDSSKWLPLWMHHKDTAGIMNYLLKCYLSPSFAISCGLDNDELKKTALFIANIHDIGKATIAFQSKISKCVPDCIPKLKSCGIEVTDRKYSTISHNLAGEEILRYFGCPPTISTIVGAHHGIPSESCEIRDSELDQDRKEIIGFGDFFGDNERNYELLKYAWKTIIDAAFSYSGISSFEELPTLSSTAQILISGLLITADWIASNIEYYPLINTNDTGNENHYPYRSERAWKEIRFPHMWLPPENNYTPILKARKQ